MTPLYVVSESWTIGSWGAVKDNHYGKSCDEVRVYAKKAPSQLPDALILLDCYSSPSSPSE